MSGRKEFLKVRHITQLIVVEDRLYLAYTDEFNGYRSIVLELTGQGWIPVGGGYFSPPNSSYLSVGASPDGDLLAVFRDESQGAGLPL